MVKVPEFGWRWTQSAQQAGFATERAPRLGRRQFLFPLILAAHVALLLMLPFTLSTAPPASARGGSTKLFNVGEAEDKMPVPEPPRPAAVVRPEPIVRFEVETVTLAAEPIFDDAAAARAGFGTTCDIAETLRRAFEENEPVRAALARVRPEERSVANAIMIWDGEWVELGDAADSGPGDTIRRGIAEGVRAAPAECLRQDVAGPRFIPVRENDGTTVLVLGSGLWRWEELLAAEAEITVSQAETVRRSAAPALPRER